MLTGFADWPDSLVASITAPPASPAAPTARMEVMPGWRLHLEGVTGPLGSRRGPPGKFRSFRPGAEEGRAISALLGRAVETGSLVGVLAAVRDGLSGVLVLRGEAGVGKTALLDWAAGQAGDMQVARVAGAEAEMDMGFGLHQLLVPFLGGLEGLPAPQRQALGRRSGWWPARRRTGSWSAWRL